MSGASVFPALQIKGPDVINALQQYANVGKTDAETGLIGAQTVTEHERPDLIRQQAGLAGAQTAKTQIENELARLNLGVSQYWLNSAQGSGNAANEPLPGHASESSSYGNVPSVERQPGVTAGMQANNPGNLMYAGQEGASGTMALSGGRQLAVFPDMPSGIAATVHQLELNQDKHGISTVRQQVERWVSDPKADLTTYIADTAKALGVGPDDKVDWHDPRVQAAFIKAQYPHESAGGKTSLSDSDVNAGVLLAHGQGGPGRTQVAASGNGPASWGVGGGQAQPPAGGGGGPNALAVSNPMGTSSQGVVMPGLGVAVPKAAALSIAGAADKPAAINKVLADRRQTLASLAGSATDGASWNNNVAQAWRMGYLTNAEFQQYYNHPEFRDRVIAALSSPEAQMNNTRGYFDKGFTVTPTGPQFKPEYTQGQQPITIEEPVLGADGKPMVDSQGAPITRKVTYSAPGFHAGPGAPGGAATAPPAAPAPAAPPPAVASPPPATTAPNGNTISGIGAENGPPLSVPPGMEPVRGSDNNWYLRPTKQTEATTAGPAAPVPSASGTVTAPAPAGSTPAVPPGAAALPSGAIGAGPITETPGIKQKVELETKAREAQIEVEKARQVETNKQAIEIANTEGKKVADAYGEQAGTIAKNAVLAPGNLEKLDILENAARDVQTGPSAATRTAAVNRIVDTLGLLGIQVPESVAKQAAAAGAIEKLGGFLAAAQVRMLGQREAASVFDAIKGFNPNLAQSPQAFNAVIQSLRQDALRDQDLERFRLQWVGDPAHHSSIAGMMDAFNKEHSTQSYASRVIPVPAVKGEAPSNNVIYRLPNGSVMLYLDHGPQGPGLYPPATH